MMAMHDALGRRYDFGDDAPAPPSDPGFNAWIRAAAPALNAPGSPPADAMWAAIVAAQAASRAAAHDRSAGVTPLRRRSPLMPAALAATLLLGVAIGRLVAARQQHAAAPAAVPAVVDAHVRRDLYRVATVQTLSQAEALLTAYRAGGRGARADSATRPLGGWARDVLGSTRLLLDSPAGADPQLRPLLSDVELVLVQIVRLSGTPLDSADRALIDRALRDRDLLPRIRTTVPAGATDAPLASDD